MKFTDWLTNSFGTDKVMHFLGGAWITSLFSPIGWWGILIGIIITLILSFVKELWLDTFFDYKDIVAATLGSCTSVILYLLIYFIIL